MSPSLVIEMYTHMSELSLPSLVIERGIAIQK